MYSPAALNMSHGKSLFVVYQLLRLSRDLHDRGLALGEITLSDILVTDNFTIKVYFMSYLFYVILIFKCEIRSEKKYSNILSGFCFF